MGIPGDVEGRCAAPTPLPTDLRILAPAPAEGRHGAAASTSRDHLKKARNLLSLRKHCAGLQPTGHPGSSGLDSA